MTLMTLQTIAAQEQSIAVAQIVKREKQERSWLPEGLRVKERASLLDYLKSLSKAK